jgi:hypothetical protein
MFRMFPVVTSRNLTTNNTGTRSVGTSSGNGGLQFTSRVLSVSQIYNTKGSSCSSCGGGRR